MPCIKGGKTMEKTVFRKRRLSSDVLCVNIVGYVLLGLFALICVLPFYLIIIASFTQEQSLIRDGYPLFIKFKNFSLEAYQLALIQI